MRQILLRAVANIAGWLFVVGLWMTGYYTGWHFNELEHGEKLDAVISRRVECQNRCGPNGCPNPQAQPPAPSKPIKIDVEPGVPTPYQTSVRLHYRIGDDVSTGSGTIVDGCPQRALVLTCAHMFRDVGGIYPKPREARGTLSVDLYKSAKNGFAVPELVRTLPGRLVDLDGRRDVGLVSFKADDDLPASPLVLDDFKPERGDRFISVGCSKGRDPSAREHRLLGERGDGVYAAWEMSNAPVEGRSGGGLFTPGGRLAGVCLSYDGPQGQYAHPASMRFVLSRNGRDDLAHPQPTAAKDASDPDLSIIPGQAGRITRPTPQAPEPERPPTVTIEPPAAPAIPAPVDVTTMLCILGGFALTRVYDLLKRAVRFVQKTFSDETPPPARNPPPLASFPTTAGFAPPDPKEELRGVLGRILDHAERQKAELSRDARVSDLLANLYPTSSTSPKAGPAG